MGIISCGEPYDAKVSRMVRREDSWPNSPVLYVINLNGKHDSWLSLPTLLIITAHAFVMIFFMVMFVFTSYNEGLFNITINTKQYSTASNVNKKKQDPNKAPHRHTKHIIKDPRVRAIIVILLLLLLRKQSVFLFLQLKMVLVISVVLFLYMLELFLTLCRPTGILKKGDRRVLRYFHKYGFKDVTLTLLIMDPNSTSEMAVQLEQYCMDTLLPDLNVDPVASSSGYHEPMSEYWRDYLRKLRGTKVFIYDTETAQLVFMSDSVQYIADHVGIHRSTIVRYTTTAELFLNRFLISGPLLLKWRIQKV